jgi:mannose-6-phosphate isomerase-like protein (cupin superfamily)
MLSSARDEIAGDSVNQLAAGPDFARDGFVGAVPLLTAADCRAILDHVTSGSCPPPAAWPKGRAATDWFFARLGAHPRLLALLTPILGADIVLWGASIVRRDPRDEHSWHVDAESSAPDGRFATVWIGLENTTAESGLRLVAGSHLCGKTVQQFGSEKRTGRAYASTETVLEWARSLNPDARLAEPPVGDGDAILFDGRMWHGSHNRSTSKSRTALLLQFAAADSPVRMPDPAVKGWPFEFLGERPPVVCVHGKPDESANLVVPAPTRSAPEKLAPLPSTIRKLDTPLAQKPRGGWRPYPLFRGSTPALDFMQCHAAVLSPGYIPHPPHAHADEELLIVLDGEAELLIADRPEVGAARPVAVKTGDFAYYPPGQHHTIRNPGSAPVTYVMFRWRRPGAAPAGERLKTRLFRAPPAPEPNGRGFSTRQVFSGPTRWLRKLHCHTSRVEAGAGYAPHVDPYDVAIFIQSGRVRTLGREVGPGALVWCTAGDLHGMRNVGDEPATYLVFEFHGAPLSVEQAAAARSTSLGSPLAPHPPRPTKIPAPAPPAAAAEA